MRLVLAVLAGAALGAGGVGAVWALGGGDEHARGSGEVLVELERGPRAQERLLRPLVARVAQTLNSELDLPADLSVKVIGEKSAREVGAAGPLYDPTARTVYIPWAFVARSRSELQRVRSAGRLRGTVDEVLAGAMVFVLLHELGHGLIDQLELPVVGGEEDAADSFAAIATIATGRGAELVPLSAAALLDAQAHLKGQGTLADYADEHDLNEQRVFDNLCRVYGSDPRRHARLVGGAHGLPPGRAQVCEFDYRRELRSWERLLDPWLSHERGLPPPPD